MERDYEVCQVGWLPCSIWTIGFLREIFEDYGVSCDSGFLLIVDDLYQERLFKNEFAKSSNGSVVRVELKKLKKGLLNNYCTGIATLGDDATKENVDRYLEEQGFFPVLITGTILPSEFREGYFVFKIQEADLACITTKVFSEHLLEMKQFIVKNVKSICQALDLLDTSSDMVYAAEVRYKNLFKLFLAVSEVYRLFWRNKYGENFEAEFRKYYIANALRYMKKIADFSDGTDISEILAENAFACVDTGMLRAACQADEVDQESLCMLNAGNAVVYDEEFYYFSESGLHNLCRPLLEQMSWLELKQLMAEKGLIDRVESGFTSKKTFTVDGISQRIRVMKVHREALLSENRGDMLEEYIQDKEYENYE